MRIKTTQVETQELMPGDLFSTAGSDYWDTIDLNESIGERVYIRTNTPTPDPERGLDVFKIEVEEK